MIKLIVLISNTDFVQPSASIFHSSFIAHVFNYPNENCTMLIYKTNACTLNTFLIDIALMFQFAVQRIAWLNVCIYCVRFPSIVEINHSVWIFSLLHFDCLGRSKSRREYINPMQNSQSKLPKKDKILLSFDRVFWLLINLFVYLHLVSEFSLVTWTYYFINSIFEGNKKTHNDSTRNSIAVHLFSFLTDSLFVCFASAWNFFYFSSVIRSKVLASVCFVIHFKVENMSTHTCIWLLLFFFIWTLKHYYCTFMKPLKCCKEINSVDNYSNRVTI